MADQISPAQMREIQKLMETMKAANNPAAAKRGGAKKKAAKKAAAAPKKIAGAAPAPARKADGRKPVKALIAGAAPALPKRILPASHVASGQMNKQVRAAKPNMDQRIALPRAARMMNQAAPLSPAKPMPLPKRGVGEARPMPMPKNDGMGTAIPLPRKRATMPGKKFMGR